MTCYTEEIFAPVLVCLTADTLSDAIEMTNNAPYGNGCCIFTTSGAAARKYQYEIDCGQVGLFYYYYYYFFFIVFFMFVCLHLHHQWRGGAQVSV
jgi:acyl-CoA reductase-like NAD-dependent aldehyde dehydrogenase